MRSPDLSESKMSDLKNIVFSAVPPQEAAQGVFKFFFRMSCAPDGKSLSPDDSRFREHSIHNSEIINMTSII
jgi:hypothetical protein